MTRQPVPATLHPTLTRRANLWRSDKKMASSVPHDVLRQQQVAVKEAETGDTTLRQCNGNMPAKCSKSKDRDSLIGQHR